MLATTELSTGRRAGTSPRNASGYSTSTDGRCSSGKIIEKAFCPTRLRVCSSRQMFPVFEVDPIATSLRAHRRTEHAKRLSALGAAVGGAPAIGEHHLSIHEPALAPTCSDLHIFGAHQRNCVQVTCPWHSSCFAGETCVTHEADGTGSANYARLRAHNAHRAAGRVVLRR